MTEDLEAFPSPKASDSEEDPQVELGGLDDRQFRLPVGMTLHREGIGPQHGRPLVLRVRPWLSIWISVFWYGLAFKNKEADIKKKARWER